eukprot:358605-Chlamydomonas_euryale.AAC.12
MGLGRRGGASCAGDAGMRHALCRMPHATRLHSKPPSLVRPFVAQALCTLSRRKPRAPFCGASLVHPFAAQASCALLRRKPRAPFCGAPCALLRGKPCVPVCSAPESSMVGSSSPDLTAALWTSSSSAGVWSAAAASSPARSACPAAASPWAVCHRRRRCCRYACSPHSHSGCVAVAAGPSQWQPTPQASRPTPPAPTQTNQPRTGLCVRRCGSPHHKRPVQLHLHQPRPTSQGRACASAGVAAHTTSVPSNSNIFSYPLSHQPKTLYEHPELYEAAFSYRDMKQEVWGWSGCGDIECAAQQGVGTRGWCGLVWAAGQLVWAGVWLVWAWCACLVQVVRAPAGLEHAPRPAWCGIVAAPAGANTGCCKSGLRQVHDEILAAWSGAK